MENEEDYVRVVPTTSGNNGGNKIKLRSRIESDRVGEKDRREEGEGRGRKKRKREFGGQNAVLLFKIKREGKRVRVE